MRGSTVISRDEAAASGSLRYFTNEACRNGHISERSTKSGKCIECAYAATQLWRERNKCFEKATMQAYRNANSETIRRKRAERRMDNIEAHRQRSAAHYHANKDRYKENVLRWREANTERVKAAQVRRRDEKQDQRRAYEQANKGRRNASTRARQLRQTKATPAWLTPDDFREMARFYDLAQSLQNATGIPHQVDHVIPLQGRLVCGLHVPSNLCVLTASENLSKSNTFDVT